MVGLPRPCVGSPIAKNWVTPVLCNPAVCPPRNTNQMTQTLFFTQGPQYIRSAIFISMLIKKCQNNDLRCWSRSFDQRLLGVGFKKMSKHTWFIMVGLPRPWVGSTIAKNWVTPVLCNPAVRQPRNTNQMTQTLFLHKVHNIFDQRFLYRY
jgi:hypothetical protein